MKPWFEIKAKSDDVAEVWIYDEIGEDWFGEGITAKRFVEEINALEVGEIALHINSPGGSVFDGQAIHTALKRHAAKVTTYIDGLAASIASVIALAGDSIVMPSNAMLMIHDPWGLAIGNAKDMRQMADTLEKVGESILNVYDERSTKSREELAAAMAAETWLTADDAIEYGFIDEVAGEVRLAAGFDLSRFKHPPAQWAAKLDTGEEPQGLTPTEDIADGPAEEPTASPAEGGHDAGDAVYRPGTGTIHLLSERS